MATLDGLTSQIRAKGDGLMPAPRTVSIKREHWLEEAKDVPKGPIVVGIRTPNDEDYAKARSASNDDDALLSIISVGVCDPNDVTKAHPAIKTPDIILSKLKPMAKRMLFDAIERMHVETCVSVPVATDEDLFAIGNALIDGQLLEELEGRAPAEGARIRRLAGAIMEALGLD